MTQALPRPALHQRTLSWVLLAVASCVLLGIATFDDGGPRTNEERVQHLSTVYACPQCDGQSVAESNAAVAATIRDSIRVKVGAGATDQEIRDELIRAYGTDVLLTPPAEGVSLLVWILPVLVVVGGGALVASILLRRDQSSRTATDEDQELVAKARESAEGQSSEGQS